MHQKINVFKRISLLFGITTLLLGLIPMPALSQIGMVNADDGVITDPPPDVVDTDPPFDENVSALDGDPPVPEVELMNGVAEEFQPLSVNEEIGTEDPTICLIGIPCSVNMPAAPDGWQDGLRIDAQMYMGNGDADDVRVEDKADPSNTSYELECADPDIPIYIGTDENNPIEHSVILTDPYSPAIINIFGGVSFIDDLITGVNVAEMDQWDGETERLVFWNLLGVKDYNDLDDGQKAKADDIRSGNYVYLLEKVSILFLMPPDITTQQLTFAHFCAESKPGCTNPAAINYDPTANVDDGACEFEEEIPGCIDPTATNYDPAATEDNGSCEFEEEIPGCTDPGATNYDPTATEDNGTCEYDEEISDDPSNTTTVALVTPQDSLIIPVTGVDLEGEFPLHRRLMLLVGATLLTSGLFIKGTTKKERKP